MKPVRHFGFAIFSYKCNFPFCRLCFCCSPLTELLTKPIPETDIQTKAIFGNHRIFFVVLIGPDVLTVSAFAYIWSSGERTNRKSMPYGSLHEGFLCATFISQSSRRF